LFNLLPNTVGAVWLELETERTLFNLFQVTTSRTDSTYYCMTSPHPVTFIIKSRPINSFLWFQKCFLVEFSMNDLN